MGLKEVRTGVGGHEMGDTEILLKGACLSFLSLSLSLPLYLSYLLGRRRFCFVFSLLFLVYKCFVGLCSCADFLFSEAFIATKYSYLTAEVRFDCPHINGFCWSDIGEI